MITIRMKPAYLKYNKIFSQANEGVHYINPIGIRNEEIFISDGLVPSFPSTIYHNWTNTKMIYDGWAERENMYFIFEPNFFGNIEIRELKDSFASKFKKALITYLDGGISEDTYYGRDAAKEFNE